MAALRSRGRRGTLMFLVALAGLALFGARTLEPGSPAVLATCGGADTVSTDFAARLDPIATEPATRRSAAPSPSESDARSIERGQLVVDVRAADGGPASLDLALHAQLRTAERMPATDLVLGEATELPRGAYVVELSCPLPPGHVLGGASGRDAWSRVGRRSFEAHVRVEPGEVTELPLVLHRSARVVVQVVDPTGGAARDVVVRVAADDGLTGTPIPVVATLPVDEAGLASFDVAVHDSGATYVVRAFPAAPDALASEADPLAGWTRAATIRVGPGDSADVRLQIVGGRRRLGGHVLDELGEGCAGLRVVAYGEDGAARGGAMTDALGAFLIEGLEDEPLTLRVTEDDNPLGDRDGGVLHGWGPRLEVERTGDALELELAAIRRKPALVEGRLAGSARAFVQRGEATLELLLREHRTTRTGRVDQALAVPVDDEGRFSLRFEWGPCLPAELRLLRRDGVVLTGVPVDLRHGIEDYEVLLH